MEYFLVLTAVGTDRPGISDEITRLITHCGCNIVDSRIALFGHEFTLIMLLSGNANAISRVESTLPLKAQQHDLLTVMKRTAKHETRHCPYTAELHIEAEDIPGLTQHFTKFMAARNIDIAALSAHTQESQNSDQTNRFIIQMTVNLPENSALITVQADFQHLCEALKAQGSIHFIGYSTAGLPS